MNFEKKCSEKCDEKELMWYNEEYDIWFDSAKWEQFQYDVMWAKEYDDENPCRACVRVRNNLPRRRRIRCECKFPKELANFKESRILNCQSICLMCDNGHSKWGNPFSWRCRYSTYELRVCFLHWDNGSHKPRVKGRAVGEPVFKLRKKLHEDLIENRIMEYHKSMMIAPICELHMLFNTCHIQFNRSPLQDLIYNVKCSLDENEDW